VLGLKHATDKAWAARACDHLEEILVDHAHCELKAASNATSLVARYAMHPRLVRELTALAQEELGHVIQVYDAMTARGVERCPEVGSMRLYETPWDGLFPMERLVRWVSA